MELCKLSRRPTILALIFVLSAAELVFSPTARAQNDDYRLANNEFGSWGGYSFDSPHVFGASSHRRLALVALRYSRRLFSTEHLSLYYTVDVLPLELVNQPTVVPVLEPGPPPFTAYFQTGRELVYAGGLNPIGLKLNFLRKRQFQPFIASSIGFVAATKPIPLDTAGEDQFNFTFDFQGGFQRFNASHTRAWMIGYRFQHISNAYRSSLNPGMDANVIFIGYSFFK